DSTRTAAGWFQKYDALPVTENLEMGGPPTNWVKGYGTGSIGPSTNNLGSQASPSLDRIISYAMGWPNYDKETFEGENLGNPSNAPYIWETSTGKRLGRWPTTMAQTPEGEHFVGIPQASTDFSHFVFSSNV